MQAQLLLLRMLNLKVSIFSTYNGGFLLVAPIRAAPYTVCMNSLLCILVGGVSR